MIRRYRCLIVVACLTAFVVALGLPWVGLSICGVGTEVSRVEAPAVTPERVGDRPEPASPAPTQPSVPPRAPPFFH